MMLSDRLAWKTCINTLRDSTSFFRALPRESGLPLPHFALIHDRRKISRDLCGLTPPQVPLFSISRRLFIGFCWLTGFQALERFRDDKTCFVLPPCAQSTPSPSPRIICPSYNQATRPQRLLVVSSPGFFFPNLPYPPSSAFHAGAAASLRGSKSALLARSLFSLGSVSSAGPSAQPSLRRELSRCTTSLL